MRAFPRFVLSGQYHECTATYGTGMWFCLAAIGLLAYILVIVPAVMRYFQRKL